ncbi:hypothetical protein PUR_03610 [Paenibacillus sp. URB8-2]|nr:hypothetical protein PUR_03610 [Paenibacillus sp. URB8-2]
MNKNIRESEAASLDNAVLSLLGRHVSVRKFRQDPVSEEQLAAIIGAAQMASTSSNVRDCCDRSGP